MTNATLFITPSSTEGKSVLERLTPEERAEMLQWMSEHPGENGMNWPGWFNTAELRRLMAGQEHINPDEFHKATSKDFKFAVNLHDGEVTHSFVRGPTGLGMTAIFDKGISPAQSNRLNPLQCLPEDIEYIMDFLVVASGLEVSPVVKDKAKEVILAAVARKSEITILDAVDAFDLEPDLKEFGAALRKVALPGPFGKYFVDPAA